MVDIQNKHIILLTFLFLFIGFLTTSNDVINTFTGMATQAPTIPISLDNYVKHLYECILERTPSQSEISYWSNLLSSKSITIGDSYKYFFDFQEYILKQTSNDKFVTQLYNCILFRDPDVGGFDWWVSLLNNNARTRTQEVNDFITSNEFITYIKPKLNSLIG